MVELVMWHRRISRVIARVRSVQHAAWEREDWLTRMGDERPLRPRSNPWIVYGHRPGCGFGGWWRGSADHAGGIIPSDAGDAVDKRWTRAAERTMLLRRLVDDLGEVEQAILRRVLDGGGR